MDDGRITRSDCNTEDQRRRWDELALKQSELESEIWGSGSVYVVTSKEQYEKDMNNAFDNMAKAMRESFNERLDDICLNAFYDSK